MGLFSFFGTAAPNKKKDMDGKEIVDFTDYTVPIPVVHSNQINSEHDVFAKAMNDYKNEISLDDTEASVVRDIIPMDYTPMEDLSSMNRPEEKKEEVQEVSEEPIVNNDDMEIFKACLLAEVKRKRSTGQFSTPEEAQDFCKKKMEEYKNGTFDYPQEVRVKMRKVLEAQDMINDLNGKPRVLSGEDVVVRKVA